MAIVDSSAYVKYFSKEPGWDSAAVYLIQPTSIWLAFAEVANALSKKVALQEISQDDAKLLLGKMMEVTKVVGGVGSVIPAIEVSREKRITVYDALFIVAALENNLGLATSDARQARAAQELGVSVDIV